MKKTVKEMIVKTFVHANSKHTVSKDEIGRSSKHFISRKLGFAFCKKILAILNRLAKGILFIYCRS